MGRASITQTGTREVDLLFVVDDSGSMAQEQANLAKELPNLVRVLTSGKLDDDPAHDFPALDLHVAVVSTNMGAPISHESCEQGGLDGVFISSACSEPSVGSPSYLSIGANDGDAADARVKCMVELGTEGCGIEQQLEASLKALTSADSPVRFARGDKTGHEQRENKGFLRKDSLVVVLLVSDEDDCSGPDLGFVASAGRELNLACSKSEDEPYPLERYLTALRALRPEREDHVLFAAITGVPPDLVEDPEHIDYAALLEDPRMRVRSDGDATTPQPVPACRPDQLAPGEDAETAGAAPARRIVRLARDFGAQGLVQSICKTDFRGALSALLKKISAIVGGACLPRKLAPDGQGLVNCNVIEYLPTGHSCSERPGRTALPYDTCRVSQVPATQGSPGEGAGFYYDETDTQAYCPVGAGRIRFTDGAEPMPGAQVELECLERIEAGAGEPRNQGAVGLPCSPQADSCPGKVDRQSYPQLRLFCDEQTRVCEQACASDADCGQALVCDSSSERAKCVNPICS